MNAGLFLLGFAIVFFILLDGFETVVVPRRVAMPFQIARMFYTTTWRPWAWIGKKLRSKRRRENYLSFYGPSSLILLLVIWVVGAVVGFALMFQSLAATPLAVEHGQTGFLTALYFSASNFFTLGLGDVKPVAGMTRLLTVIEAGTGFGLLAMVIGFLPVLYKAFSDRELNISLLDARAGSPPTAIEMLRRYSRSGSADQLETLLRDWEHWSADLLETHLSYPVLAYFRSQHTNQSWLGSVTMILDTCSLILATGGQESHSWQAKLTFAMARHALVDLSQVLKVRPLLTPEASFTGRLGVDDPESIRSSLARAGLKMSGEPEPLDKLSRLRRLYEPYSLALAGYLHIQLPPWLTQTPRPDDWRTSAYEPPTDIEL